jgi:hypothetical protein
MKTEMDAQELAAAALLFEGEPVPRAAKKVGFTARTLLRHMEKPHFKAHMAHLRAEKAAELKALATPPPDVTVKPVNIVFTRNDAAMRYLRIADSPIAKHSEQRLAVDSLVSLFGLAKQPIVTPNPQGQEATPDKPSFYRSAWRDQVQ